MAFVSRKSNRKSTGAVQSTRKATTTEAVSNRDFVVICADRAGRVATFAENTNYIESYSVYGNDVKLNMFEQLREVLSAIPCHADELLDKQVAIYVPSAIFGNIGDMYRSEKYESCQDIMLEVADMLNERALNCFTVDIKGSKATIVQNAYDFVQEESKKANAQADGVEYVAKAKAVETNNASSVIAEKLAQLEVQIADAMIAGDDDKVARIESAIARLKGMNKPAVKQQADELSNVAI